MNKTYSPMNKRGFRVDSDGFREEFWSEDGNRMLLSTGCKKFDKQTSALMSGQQIGDTITSFFVRPHSELECNGHTFRPGQLRQSDIDRLGRDLCYSAKAWLERNAEAHVLVHCLFHWKRRTKYVLEGKVLDGAVVVDYDHNLVQIFYGNSHYKSGQVVDVCATYLCRMDPEGKFILSEKEFPRGGTT